MCQYFDLAPADHPMPELKKEARQLADDMLKELEEDVRARQHEAGGPPVVDRRRRRKGP